MQYVLSARGVQRHAATLLCSTLRLTDFGRRCSAHTLLQVVFTACARLTSVFAAALDLAHAPSPETVRQALRRNLPEPRELERRLQKALQASLPALRQRRRRRYRLAIDLTLIPYHGRPQRAERELYRGQSKSGTTHFHAYATAYLVERGQRLTVALTWVQHGEAMADVLKRLLRSAATAGVRPRLVLLDRGFYTAAVVRYLQAARYPFLLPVPLKGRRPDHRRGVGGTRVFATWRRSGFSRYTLHPTGGRPATVGIAVHCRRRAGRRGRRGRECLVYAFWGFLPPAPAAVSRLDRLRFGIESSYRQLNQARARTCTRDPGVRLFLVGVALVLRNVWVWLHREVLSRPRRGGRCYRWSCLRFKRLLTLLQQVAQRVLGSTTAVPSERPLHATLQ